MFAMLQGPWPRATLDGTSLEALEAAVVAGEATAAELEVAVERVVDEAIAAQVGAGMGLVTDGSVRWADPARAVLDALRDGDVGARGLLVRAWRATAEHADVPVAQAVPGPWTLAVREVGESRGGEVLAGEVLGGEVPGEVVETGEGRGGEVPADSARAVAGEVPADDVRAVAGRAAALADDVRAVAGRAAALADVLAAELEALAAAGCPVVRVDEPAAVAIGADEGLRQGFLDAQRRLLRRAGNLHAMLAIVGGSAAEAGAATILGAPYASFLFDLIAGPDNWTLVRAAPGDRGIVCAALRAGGGRERLDQAPELAWAARYAASAMARGLVRVGLANATPLGGLSPEEATATLEALGRAAGLAALPPDEAVRAGMDPRTITQRPGGLPPETPARPGPS